MGQMLNRRHFLIAGTTAALTCCIGQKGEQRHNIFSLQEPFAERPDTLDLADRAELVIRGITQVTDPDHHYETYQCSHIDHRPPYMTHRWGGPGLQKPVHVLPLLRRMSGSTINADIDEKMLESLLRDVESDGLWWLKVEGRPWRAETFKRDQCWPVAHARLMVALLDRYQFDPNGRWLEIVDRMSKGLARIALRNEDRAWYHTAYTRAGWLEHPDSTEETQEASRIAEEPSTRPFYDIGLPLRAFSRWFAVSGDTEAKEMADRLGRFLLKPSMWGSREGASMIPGPERAHWEGHFHTHTMGMMGLLEYGLATKDTATLRFVANFYEYGRQFGIARMGFFPAVIGPLPDLQKRNREYGEGGQQVNEGCAVADMLWLAAKLSEAGVADYWDDVDQYARNQLVEQQMTRRDLLEAIVASAPEHRLNPSMETVDRVLERNLGLFASGSDPTMLYAWWTICCVGNCSMALYKAWDSIVQAKFGLSQVNLLLNRRSPWVDIDSYLPYEGRIVLTNKTAQDLFVRMPFWVDRSALRVQVGDRQVPARWVGNYTMLDHPKPSQPVVIEFPLAETVEHHTEPTYGVQYTCHFKGNTLVDISPRADRPAWTQMGDDAGAMFPVTKGHPTYQRDFFRKDKAPMKRTSS